MGGNANLKAQSRALCQPAGTSGRGAGHRAIRQAWFFAPFRASTVTIRFFLPALLACLALPAAGAEYTIDPSHTYATFEIDHMGFSTQRGLFRQTSGQIRFDLEARAGEIEIRIDAASLDTGFGLRDDVLRSADWFNVQAFPDIIFRSQHFVFDEARPVAVEGKLIMLGEMRPMRLEITRFKCGLNIALRQRGCGADAQGALRRSEFGMQTGLPFIGDEVRLRVQVEAYQP